MANLLIITDTFKIDGEQNPLMVNATVEVELENGSYSWAVSKINYVELVIGDKVGIDITKQAIGTPRSKALIESQVGSQDEQIIDSFRDQIERRVAI